MLIFMPIETRQGPNQSMEPTGGSRCAQIAVVSQRRLPPVAHARRYVETCGTPKAL